MMPKAFTNLFEVGNKCIVACENFISTATNCEDDCSNGSARETSACSVSAHKFIEESKECIASCEACIKVCDEMIVQFNKEGHKEHMEALNRAVKVLGECVRVCRSSVDACEVDKGSCKEACSNVRDVCERAVMAVDECIESCEKHEVVYLNLKKY